MKPRIVDLGPEPPSGELYDDALSVAGDYPVVRLPTQVDAGSADGADAADEWARVCAELTTASDWAD